MGEHHRSGDIILHINSHMVSIGKALILRQKRRYDHLDVTWANAFFDTIYTRIEKEYAEQMCLYQKQATSNTIEMQDIQSIYMSFFSEACIEKIRKKFIMNKQALHIAFEEVITSYGISNKDIHDARRFNTHKNRIVSMIRHLEFRHLYDDITEDVIIVLDTFRKDIFHRMPNHLKGVIVRGFSSKQEEKQAMVYAKEFHVPLVESTKKIAKDDMIFMDHDASSVTIVRSEKKMRSYQKLVSLHDINHYDKAFKKHPNIKLYASIADGRFVEAIARSPWYQGVGHYKSEYFYDTYGGKPIFDDIVAEYTKILAPFQEKEFFFALPDFRPEVTIDDMKGDMTDYHSYMSNPYLFDHCIQALVVAAKTTRAKVRIVIPMVRMDIEPELWRTIVEIHTEPLFDEPIPVGYMVETETALEDFETYDGKDFTHIGLDNIIEEFRETNDKIDRYTPISRKTFIRDYAVYIRDIHQHYRYHRRPYVRHFISGHAVSNPGVFDRLTKMGLREISITAHAIRNIHQVILDRIALIGSHTQDKTEEDRKEAIQVTKKYHAY